MSTQAWVQVKQRDAEGKVRETSLTAALGAGPWVMLAPHDDDFILGAGLLSAAAACEGLVVHVAVATDGALGYVRPQEQPGLRATRRDELGRASALLGIPPDRVHALGFPDGSLIAHQGCRGLDQADTLSQRLVTLLRAVRPSTLFVCAPQDVHPDHRVCAAEAEIACVWAASQIWLERGEPCPEPQRFYYAVYAPFVGAPELQLSVGPALFEKKLAALRAFQSQGVIEPMIERLTKAGPREYFQRARQLRYEPEQYAPGFEDG